MARFTELAIVVLMAFVWNHTLRLTTVVMEVIGDWKAVLLRITIADMSKTLLSQKIQEPVEGDLLIYHVVVTFSKIQKLLHQMQRILMVEDLDQQEPVKMEQRRTIGA